MLNQSVSEDSKRFNLNPFTVVESYVKKRKLKKRQRQLKMQAAVLSGGITRMK